MAAQPIYGQDEKAKENGVKVACIYKLLAFIQWPQEDENGGENEMMTIGVLGEKDPYGDAWDLIKGKKIHDKTIQVIQLGAYGDQKEKQQECLRKIEECEILFISPSEEKNVNEIIAEIEDRSILTLADSEGFLEEGVMINFLMKDKKLRFEINLDSVKKASLEISTTVLSLAKRVVHTKKD